jgi:hypothetical protein
MARVYTFLHIGKTGGTAFRNVISKHNRMASPTCVDYINHRGSMLEIAEKDLTDNLIFFVRDPVSRFVSAFNSRLRKGRFGEREWTRDEQEAFAYFKTANELGEGLGSLNPIRRSRASRAVKSIGHLRKSLNDYLGPIKLLKREQSRIFYIGQQETLSSDFEHLKLLLEMDPSLALPTDEQKAHRSPATAQRDLSEKAAANIRRYYARDLPIYDWCLEFREELMHRHGLHEPSQYHMQRRLP